VGEAPDLRASVECGCVDPVWCGRRIYMKDTGARGGVTVKAPGYKPPGREFDSQWCHWNFSVTQSFRSHYGPAVDSASNRNEYQVYFLGVKAVGA
jgi:hypothetical protein